MSNFTQHLVFGQGGTLVLHVLDRPSTNANITILNSDGATQGTANTACTIQSIATTLSAAASAGNTTISVTSATGIASKDELWIRSPDEKVRIRSVSGTTLTLQHPLLHAHANGSTFESTKISVSLNSSFASNLFWDGRALWRTDGNINCFTAVECTRYPLTRMATAQDVYREIPKFSAYIDSEMDLENSLDVAFYDVLSSIAGKDRVRVFTGSHEFNRAVVFKFLQNFFGSLAQLEQSQYYAERFSQEISSLTSYLPRDADQDGSVEAEESISNRNVRLVRA